MRLQAPLRDHLDAAAEETLQLLLKRGEVEERRVPRVDKDVDVALGPLSPGGHGAEHAHPGCAMAAGGLQDGLTVLAEVIAERHAPTMARATA